MSDAMEGPQFHSVYRGMHVAVGYGEHAPAVLPHDDDAKLLSKLKPRPYAGGFYGVHWSDNQETSERFATGRSNNTGLGEFKARDEHHVVGVVLEAKVRTKPELHSAYSHYGEGEVRIPRVEDVHEVTAHVHELRPLGPGHTMSDRRGRYDTFVRSFSVPPEHWRQT